jgi:hypothetical protein
MLGEPLPEELEVLPERRNLCCGDTAGHARCCSVAGVPEGVRAKGAPPELLAVAREMGWPGIQLDGRTVVGESGWEFFLEGVNSEDEAAAWAALEALEAVWAQ